MAQAEHKIQRKLNVYGAGYSNHHQTGFNRSYYAHIGNMDQYLVHDTDNGIRSELVQTFAQVVQYGSIGEEFASDQEILAPSEYIVNVSCGEHHSLFVTNHRRVFSCGRNFSGGCAMADSILTVNQVTLIPELTDCNIVETKCGNLHSLFISEEYECLYVAGYNLNGECGVAPPKNIYGVAKMENIGGKKLKLVAPGAYHTVFVTVDNCVYTSGYCGFGSLGQGHPQQHSLTPNKVDHSDLWGVVAIKTVVCGEFHSVVIAEDGSAYSWGFDIYGQCGFDSISPNESVVSPALVYGIPLFEKLVDARCGKHFTVFRTESNKFYGCGENYHGGLGFPIIDKQLIVCDIPLPIGTVLDFSCGANYTVFTTKEGGIYACGERKCGFSSYSLQAQDGELIEVCLPGASYDPLHSELRVACAHNGYHTLLYSVTKTISTISEKLFTAQQKGKLCDITVVW